MKPLADTDAIKYLRDEAAQQAVDATHGRYSKREADKYANYLLTPHEQ